MPCRLTLVALAAMLLAANLASAHFPWLALDEDNHALLFFSESAAQRDYHTPDCVQQAKVQCVDTEGESRQLAMKLIDSEDYQGMQSNDAVSAGAQLNTSITYGVYHGTLLDYYVRRSPILDEAPVADNLTMRLDALPYRTSLGVAVRVVWGGQPLSDAEVSMSTGAGKPTTAKTDAQGVAKFDNAPAGNLSFFIGQQEDAAGELDGTDYETKSNYLTLTTSLAEAPRQQAGPALPALPVAVASFGAAVSDGHLYVYSGHTGEEHVHSKENLSTHFARLKLDGGQSTKERASEVWAWEELPMQQPLQGLPLVAHAGKLYRVGGLNHRNAAEEDPDMHSTDTAACFDPATGEWTDLPALPSARSSHDAVVIGDKLYVVGGWKLSGDSNGDWLTDALCLDLVDPSTGWQAIEQPFQRRAIAAAQLDNKLIVLGGMEHDQGITSKVAAYDPATDEWTDLPDVPGRAGGFGVSAWNLSGTLYTSGMQGVVYALEPGATEWRTAAKIDDPRFFHRLLPGVGDELLVVAGASTEDGHVATIERIKLAE